MKRLAVAMALGLLGSSMAYSQVDTEITGSVSSKCTIYTDKSGIYGNPLPDTLSTASIDGGRSAIIRYDVVNANTYKAVITTLVTFPVIPTLCDSLTWSGTVTVSQVTDAQQSAYDSNKRVFDNVTEIDLTVAGIVWFSADSSVTYGVNKSLPGGTYKAIVRAECIAL